MDCTHATEVLPWFLNGTLGAEERRAVEEHLESCEDCRRELADTRFAGDVFRRHLPAEALVDLGFGRTPADLDAAALEAHLATCPKCSAELEMVRESAASASQDDRAALSRPEEARVLPFEPPRQEARRPRGALPLWSRAALAAGIAGVAAAGWMAKELAEVSRELREPAMNVRVVDAKPVGSVYRDGERPAAVEIPAAAETLVLLLQGPFAEEYPSYELELSGASGELLFRGAGLVRQPEGDFTVRLETGSLPREELTLRVLGRRGEERREVARYLLAPTASVRP